jgi:hypothetical protein
MTGKLPTIVICRPTGTGLKYAQFIIVLEVKYTVKKVIVFPAPSLDVTNQTLPGRELLNFMYQRPTLCTLHIAVDFLKSLKIAVVWGGGGLVLGYS